MNKHIVIEKIIAQLTSEIEAYEKSARAAHAEATHEQNKAENKYDTRALEASYLAHGQSRQAAETEQALHAFQALRARAFAAADPVELGALVELEANGVRSFYFIGSRAGGTEVVCEEKTVLVVTPQSPLGRQLIGKRRGERLKMDLDGVRSDYRVLAVT